MNDVELAHDGAVDDGKLEEARQIILTRAEGMRCAGVWLAKHAEALAAIGLERWEAVDYMAIGGADANALTIYVYGERQREILAEIAAQIGGHWEKDFESSQFIFSQTIVGNFKVRFWADREKVCVAKVVGQETVEVTDAEAIHTLPKKKVTRDVIEWECAPLLGGAETTTEGKV